MKAYAHLPVVFLASVLLAASLHSAETVAPLTASTIYDGNYLVERAFDGDLKTRWASAHMKGAPEWLQLDFGQPVHLTRVKLSWETAFAVEYQLQVSDDAKVWKTIFSRTDGKGGTEIADGFDVHTRYLRVNGLKPTAQHPLFSIWELEFPDSDAGAILKAYIESTRNAVEEERKRLFTRVFDDQGIEEIVFAVRENGVDGHWYANFGYYAQDENRKCYRAQGRLMVLNVKTGTTRLLIDDPEGSVRDPFVHYDGKKILFSWRKSGSEQFHLYEVNLDGSGIKQLTDGIYDDIEPACLPDGGIVFVSSRCRRWVNCWLTQVGVIHRCDGDGRNIRPLSANVEHDNTPWVLPDGRILYQRWEYVDRSQVDYHHLWTMNPDGTNQMIAFGNMHPGNVYIDAKPVPGTEEALLIRSPGHGQNEHMGCVALLSLELGPDNRSALRDITGDGYRDPYPITRDVFLAAKGRKMVLLDREGTEKVLFELPKSFGGAELHEPRPVVVRAPEHQVPPRVEVKKETGLLILADAYVGRSMEGVKRGDIRKLLVLESLPKPINYTGGMDPISYGGTFTLERVLGTVPVEEDGSAYMELPANRAFFFVAMDENNLSVKRMQSFLTLMPGEVQSCVGCHEQRTQTMALRGSLQAMRREPSKVQPLEGMPEVFDFPRDIQPVLDRHCVSCHGYDAPAGGAGEKGKGPYAGKVILTGDRGPMFSQSYFHLTLHKQFVDGRNRAQSNLPPRTIGSAASPIMKKLSGEHHGVKVSPREADLIRYWIESGAAYPGTYAALGTGMIGGYAQNQQVETGSDWPEAKAAGEVIGRRCAACHSGERALPRDLSDEIGISFWRMDLNDKRLQFSRHRVFNLTRPDKSLLLLAPLARAAGGFETCVVGEKKTPVFVDANDPDYRKLLALCERGKQRLDEIKRFDMPDFQPRAEYIREMVRYGVLPSDRSPHAEVDPYKTDRTYWETLWYRPAE